MRINAAVSGFCLAVFSFSSIKIPFPRAQSRATCSSALSGLGFRVREQVVLNRFLTERWLFAGLLTIFVVLRIGVLWHAQADLHLDPDAYLGIAEKLANGQGFSSPETGQPTAYRPPLYPLLLTPVSRPDQVGARAGLHLTLAMITFLVVWQTGRQLQLSRWQICVAILFLTCDPLALRYLALPMTETLCTCLTAVLLMLLTAGPCGVRSPTCIPLASPGFQFSKLGVPSLVTGLITGAVFGLVVLSRPTFWIFGLMFALFWGLRQGRLASSRDSSSGNSSELGKIFPVLQVAGAAMGICVMVVPWVIRNAVVMHSPILMTTHGGYTLLLGNNAAFYREVVQQPWGTIWDGSHGAGQAGWLQQTLEEAAQAGVSGEIQLDRWMSHRAQQAIASHPRTFLRACFLKFLWFWNIGPQGPEADNFSPVVLWGVRVFYILFWSLAVIGFMRVFRRIPEWERALSSGRDAHGIRGSKNSGIRVRMGRMTGGIFHQFCPKDPLAWKWRILLILIVSLNAAHLVYWSDARMRAPLLPALALLAAAAFRGPHQEVSPLGAFSKSKLLSSVSAGKGF